MPEISDGQLMLVGAVVGFLVYLINQARRLIDAKVDILIAGMTREQEANKARDLRGDEMQENLRRVTNGSGVHHSIIPKAEPQFNMNPPVIVAHDRRAIARHVPERAPNISPVDDNTPGDK